MPILTRLTERFGLRHPIVSAPMAFAGGGRLAAAVTAAGGLGLIGGGYGDAGWLDREFGEAGNQPVGCGFITWSLARQPHLLGHALARKPQVLMLSFGDPAPFAPAIRSAGVPLVCQCQALGHVEEAIAAGAAIVVAQGAEAGGHGSVRGTMAFVPEVADQLRRRAPDVLLLAAGGIADGRGLAAALMLGADGVLIGTRLWASQEALVHPGHQEAARLATGDGTLRTTTIDIARGFAWPSEFTVRVLRSRFTDTWHGREAALEAAVETEAPAYRDAYMAGDPKRSSAVVGEAAGLVREIEPAATLVERISADAEALLCRGPSLLG